MQPVSQLDRSSLASPTRQREREAIFAQVVALSGASEHPIDEFERGAVAALYWLLEGGPGPITGELSEPPTTRTLVHELAAAEALIYGPPSDRADYAYGVEHALMWAQFATCSTPAAQIAAQRGRGPAQPPAS
jgi:hypothetical protein